MKHDHFVVQSPDKPAQQLLLLFHGVGDNPVAMGAVSYTHLTLPTTCRGCRSRWSPYH